MKKIASSAIALALLFSTSSCATPEPETGIEAIGDLDLSRITVLEPYSLGDSMNFEQILEFPVEQRILGTIVDFEEPVSGFFEEVVAITWVPVVLRVGVANPAVSEDSFTFRVILNFENHARLEALAVGDKVLYLGRFAGLDDTGHTAGTPSWIFVLDEFGNMTPANSTALAATGNLFKNLDDLGFQSASYVQEFLKN